ncbi:competence/damage-inducible protein A [Phragmitibacter flavus]|uniref:CinA-like protein n=1 Tax=Phragmitibacter flavus TaxID=2576071 RepID=A0A5R8KAW1_9BACT|nr:competence/damage-inducible protein A [Phragmitibacter flavus]TLD69436.1 competence/damage-inducible protein A [Phragmitibacter flavus]
MKIEIINTGTELLIGDVINTNAAWLGQCFVELGLEVSRSTCVPDGAAIQEALGEACARVDVVIVTGGLGPTMDDVSREGASAVFGLAMDFDDEVLAWLTAFFASRGKPVNEHNKRQAMKPRGAIVMPNAHGTAPGLYLPAELGAARGLNCHVFLLPGPPRELKPMMTEQVVPVLRSLLPDGNSTECRYFKFTGMGESDISMALQGALEAIGGLEIGYCLGKGDVDVRLRGSVAALDEAGTLCREKLGEFLVSDDRRLLEQVVVEKLKEQGQWVATAESCTGGFIASRLTDVSGASGVFGLGLVTYANEAKTRQLGVPSALIEEFGAVSAEVAAAMAEGCLQVSGADHALAVTGIAGPGGGSEGKPVGTVFVALASKGRATEVRRRSYPGGRDRFKMLTSQTALDFLRRRLSGFDLPGE